jgi:hypothetical protein
MADEEKWDGIERRKKQPDPGEEERKQFRSTTAERLKRLEEGQTRTEGFLTRVEKSIGSLASLLGSSDDESSQSDDKDAGTGKPPEKLAAPTPPSKEEKQEQKQESRQKVRGLL